MKLKDVLFGVKNTYHCAKHCANCYVVASHSDDGAALIIEFYSEGDLSGEYRLVKAGDLTKAVEPWD